MKRLLMVSFLVMLSGCRENETYQSEIVGVVQKFQCGAMLSNLQTNEFSVCGDLQTVQATTSQAGHAYFDKCNVDIEIFACEVNMPCSMTVRHFESKPTTPIYQAKAKALAKIQYLFGELTRNAYLTVAVSPSELYTAHCEKK